MENGQHKLWHDSIYGALRAVVEALGPKKVAHGLWAAKFESDPEEAVRYLFHCLDSERRNKLSLDEMMWILRHGASADVHVGMVFIAEACGYEAPKRVNPETERDKLMREYIESVSRQEALVRRLEAVGGAGGRG